ncbi:MAG: agmatine deiminase family protein, partial [Saprospiraceae bacterium]|nr:agmatine deiminase family protein [Saprospiraceae bacterium]
MMYRYLSILFSLKVSAGIFILLSGCVDTDTDINTFSFPPEWAVQEAVWTDFASERVFIPNQGAKLKIIAALSRHIATKVVYDSDSLKQLALNELPRMEADLANISFVKTSSPMNWIRDPGPMFITNGNQLKVLDFGWNCYGHAYDCDGDLRGEVDVELAYGMGLEIEPVDLFLEGGGIEVSNNTIIAYKAMASQRNPDKSIEDVNHILLRALGKDQIIWLDEFPLI